MKIIFLLITITIAQPPTVDRTRADRKAGRISDADLRGDVEVILDGLETDLNNLLSDMNDETFEPDEDLSRA